MEVNTKAIEMSFNGNTKVCQFALPSEEYWNSLEKQFRDQFNINEENGLLKAKYVDEEGDLITLDSDEELRDLLAGLSLQESPLRFEFSFSTKGRKGRVLSHEERHRLRNERMMKKFGKILTKEEILQMREERKKLRAERMMQKHGKILSREERMQRRAEKRSQRCEERLKRKEERKRKSSPEAGEEKESDGTGRCFERRPRLSPEEKKEMIERRKKQRLEERQARQGKSDDDVTDWPADATHLFLDGNNMMFVTATLRDLTLKGRQRGKAEALLAAVAKSFVSSQSDSKIQAATLIFDNTRTDTTESIGATTFRICSARPQQPTSDDVLIDWAKEGQQKGESGRMVFVTSDRGLREQLKAAGALLMKPKQFLFLARRLSVADNPDDNNNTEEHLDTWFATLN